MKPRATDKTRLHLNTILDHTYASGSQDTEEEEEEEEEEEGRSATGKPWTISHVGKFGWTQNAWC